MHEMDLQPPPHPDPLRPQGRRRRTGGGAYVPPSAFGGGGPGGGGWFGGEARQCSGVCPAGCRGQAMEWSDTGIVLSARRHGENAAVVSLLTEHHGRHAGLVHGARGRRARGLYRGRETRSRPAGRRVSPSTWAAIPASWCGRGASLLLDDPPRLAALAAILRADGGDAAGAASLSAGLWRHRTPARQARSKRALGRGGGPLGACAARRAWLRSRSFGLCCDPAPVDDLAYVSPRSGRAVSQEGRRGPMRRSCSRCRPSSCSRRDDAAVAATDIVAGLRLTGWFFEKHVFAGAGRPDARRPRALQSTALQASAEAVARSAG